MPVPLAFVVLPTSNEDDDGRDDGDQEDEPTEGAQSDHSPDVQPRTGGFAALTIYRLWDIDPRTLLGADIVTATYDLIFSRVTRHNDVRDVTRCGVLTVWDCDFLLRKSFVSLSRGSLCSTLGLRATWFLSDERRRRR